MYWKVAVTTMYYDHVQVVADTAAEAREVALRVPIDNISVFSEARADRAEPIEGSKLIA